MKRYIGIIELQSNKDNEFSYWEIMQDDKGFLLAGHNTNTMFLIDKRFKIDADFSLDENLQELTNILQESID